MSDHQLITLPDGRELAWTEQGDPDGRAVVSLHGTPGSRLSRYGDAEQLKIAGVRQITYDRPGSGYSTPKPGRTVADAVGDVSAVLDAADVERCGFIGASGGGPHVLAVATLLAARCSLAYCLVGVAPFDRPDLDPYDGMDPENIRRFKTVQQGRAAALPMFDAELGALLDLGRADPMTVMGAMKLPEADLAIMRLQGAKIMRQYEESARQGAVSFVDDFIATSSAWGFDPTEAKAPVIVEYGVADVNVPAGHGAWLAKHVPNVGVRIRAEGGHRLTESEELDRLIEVAHAE